jgi:hypothetical protein
MLLRQAWSADSSAVAVVQEDAAENSSGMLSTVVLIDARQGRETARHDFPGLVRHMKWVSPYECSLTMVTKEQTFVYLVTLESADPRIVAEVRGHVPAIDWVK